jgi:hypothetical protein
MPRNAPAAREDKRADALREQYSNPEMHDLRRAIASQRDGAPRGRWWGMAI